MILLLVLAFVALVLLEAPGLIHKRRWWDLTVFGASTALGFVLSLLLALGVEFPPVSTTITNFVKGLFGLK